MSEVPHLILASGSSARQAMLSAAGVAFEIVPAQIDEEGIMSAIISECDCVEAADIAGVLAGEKARSVSRNLPGAIVIGSDQVLALGRRHFSKAASLSEARRTLEMLRG
jgi:septum formation protein